MLLHVRHWRFLTFKSLSLSLLSLISSFAEKNIENRMRAGKDHITL